MSNISISTETIVSVAKTPDEWRQFLADDAPFKKELREALGEIAAANDPRKHNFAFKGNDRPHAPGSIEAAAKKQNKHFLEKRAQNGKPKTMPVSCDFEGCPRVFRNERGKNLHIAKFHKGRLDVAPAVGELSAD